MKRAIGLFGLFFAAMTSQAVVVAFSTHGPAFSAKTQGWGYGDIKDTRIASQFSPSISGALHSIALSLQSGSGTKVTKVSLFKDSGNDIGSLLAIFEADVSTGGLKTLNNSNPDLQLVSGEKYWIESSAAIGSGMYGAWNENNQGIRGFMKFGQVNQTPNSTYNVGPNGSLPAFTVNVTPVPEPSTLLAMGFFASMTALRRRKG